jgi:sulfoxide reductase heme-binding subunit YedZ
VILSTRAANRAIKLAAFAASLTPVIHQTWALVNDRIGRDPARALERATGDWTIIFVCLTLAVTPARRILSWQALVRLRRMLGLFAFFYGTLHLLTYLLFDRFSWLDFPNGLVSWTGAVTFARGTARDMVVRPFLAIGGVAYLVMAPLAATSSPGMIRRLGGRRWRRLHRLVYVAAVAGLLHHWWPLADRCRLDAYGVLIGMSIAFRVYWARVRALRPSAAGAGSAG